MSDFAIIGLNGTAIEFAARSVSEADAAKLQAAFLRAEPALTVAVVPLVYPDELLTFVLERCARFHHTEPAKEPDST